MQSLPQGQRTDIPEIAGKSLVPSGSFQIQGYIWFGTQSGVVRFDGVRVSRPCRSKLRDREGSVWIAPPNGLDEFRESPVGSLSASNGLSSTRLGDVELPRADQWVVR
jgi:hypothetical protein